MAEVSCEVCGYDGSLSWLLRCKNSDRCGQGRHIYCLEGLRTSEDADIGAFGFLECAICAQAAAAGPGRKSKVSAGLHLKQQQHSQDMGKLAAATPMETSVQAVLGTTARVHGGREQPAVNEQAHQMGPKGNTVFAKLETQQQVHLEVHMDPSGVLPSVGGQGEPYLQSLTSAIGQQGQVHDQEVLTAGSGAAGRSTVAPDKNSSDDDDRPLKRARPGASLPSTKVPTSQEAQQQSVAGSKAARAVEARGHGVQLPTSMHGSRLGHADGFGSLPVETKRLSKGDGRPVQQPHQAQASCAPKKQGVASTALSVPSSTAPDTAGRVLDDCNAFDDLKPAQKGLKVPSGAHVKLTQSFSQQAGLHPAGRGRGSVPAGPFQAHGAGRTGSAAGPPGAAFRSRPPSKVSTDGKQTSQQPGRAFGLGGIGGRGVHMGLGPRTTPGGQGWTAPWLNTTDKVLPSVGSSQSLLGVAEQGKLVDLWEGLLPIPIPNTSPTTNQQRGLRMKLQSTNPHDSMVQLLSQLPVDGLKWRLLHDANGVPEPILEAKRFYSENLACETCLVMCPKFSLGAASQDFKQLLGLLQGPTSVLALELQHLTQNELAHLPILERLLLCTTPPGSYQLYFVPHQIPTDGFDLEHGAKDCLLCLTGSRKHVFSTAMWDKTSAIDKGVKGILRKEANQEGTKRKVQFRHMASLETTEQHTGKAMEKSKELLRKECKETNAKLLLGRKVEVEEDEESTAAELVAEAAAGGATKPAADAAGESTSQDAVASGSNLSQQQPAPVPAVFPGSQQGIAAGQETAAQELPAGLTGTAGEVEMCERKAAMVGPPLSQEAAMPGLAPSQVAAEAAMPGLAPSQVAAAIGPQASREAAATRPTTPQEADVVQQLAASQEAIPAKLPAMSQEPASAELAASHLEAASPDTALVRQDAALSLAAENEQAVIASAAFHTALAEGSEQGQGSLTADDLAAGKVVAGAKAVKPAASEEECNTVPVPAAIELADLELAVGTSGQQQGEQQELHSWRQFVAQPTACSTPDEQPIVPSEIEAVGLAGLLHNRCTWSMQQAGTYEAVCSGASGHEHEALLGEWGSMSSDMSLGTDSSGVSTAMAGTHGNLGTADADGGMASDSSNISSIINNTEMEDVQPQLTGQGESTGRQQGNEQQQGLLGWRQMVPYLHDHCTKAEAAATEFAPPPLEVNVGTRRLWSWRDLLPLFSQPASNDGPDPTSNRPAGVGPASASSSGKPTQVAGVLVTKALSWSKVALPVLQLASLQPPQALCHELRSQLPHLWRDLKALPSMPLHGCRLWVVASEEEVCGLEGPLREVEQVLGLTWSRGDPSKAPKELGNFHILALGKSVVDRIAETTGVILKSIAVHPIQIYSAHALVHGLQLLAQEVQGRSATRAPAGPQHAGAGAAAAPTLGRALQLAEAAGGSSSSGSTEGVAAGAGLDCRALYPQRVVVVMDAQGFMDSEPADLQHLMDCLLAGSQLGGAGEPWSLHMRAADIQTVATHGSLEHREVLAYALQQQQHSASGVDASGAVGPPLLSPLSGGVEAGAPLDQQARVLTDAVRLMWQRPCRMVVAAYSAQQAAGLARLGRCAKDILAGAVSEVVALLDLLLQEGGSGGGS